MFPLSGYIVASGVRRACGVQGLRIIVQSNRSPDYVEQRIEAFLFKMEVICLTNQFFLVFCHKVYYFFMISEIELHFWI